MSHSPVFLQNTGCHRPQSGAKKLTMVSRVGGRDPCTATNFCCLCRCTASPNMGCRCHKQQLNKLHHNANRLFPWFLCF